MGFALIFAVITFLLFMTFHVVIFHKWPPKRRFRTLIYLVIGSLGFYLIVFFASMNSLSHIDIFAAKSNNIPFVLFLVFTYFFAYYFYFHLIIVFDRSVTPRIMVELDRADGKRLTVPELKSRYSIESKFSKELDDMVFMGRMKKEGEYYKNTEKGIQHARIMECLRGYLNIGGHQ